MSVSAGGTVSSDGSTITFIIDADGHTFTGIASVSSSSGTDPTSGTLDTTPTIYTATDAFSYADDGNTLTITFLNGSAQVGLYTGLSTSKTSKSQGSGNGTWDVV